MKPASLLLIISLLISCQIDDPIINPDPDPDPVETDKYFPPISGSEWATIDTDSLGWDATGLEDLKDYMVDTKSRAIIILKDGKIAFEHYQGNDLIGLPYGENSTWYWASAGKTLTSFLVGKAQEEGYLNIDNASSDYLGEGWTSLTPNQEIAISVRHQLTMTSGLDDKDGDSNCTESNCLSFEANPGTRWAYHNAPYTLLDGVIEGATGENFDDYFDRSLKDRIGMDGFWTYLDYNHVYFSSARSMARFGLLNLNNGKWDDEVIMQDSVYFDQMVTPSQTINDSYGYLWWLNGQNSHMLPGLQWEFNGPIVPEAPSDMFSGLGKNGQIVSVVPSQNMIVVRMGENPDNSLVPVNFVKELWEKVMDIVE